MANNLSDGNKERYQSLKQQLDELVEFEVRGSILRSLSQNYEDGEKCTKYFFSLEKHRAKQKTICKLKLGTGEEITNHEQILKECLAFYENLYQSNEQIGPDPYSPFFDNPNIPKLSAEEANECEKNPDSIRAS